MTNARQRLGREAEGIAAQRLERLGMSVLARNVRPPGIRGELDLIALDGETLVFVEVKARATGSTRGPETPALAVGPRKQARIRLLAAAWLREARPALPWFRDLRFDVVGLRVDAAGHITEYEHLRGAF